MTRDAATMLALIEAIRVTQKVAVTHFGKHLW